MRLAAVQLAGDAGQLPTPRIVERMTKMLESAATAGADFVVYPELAFTSYFPFQPYPGLAAARPWFQDLPDGLTKPLFERADSLGVDLVVPYGEWADGERYNSALVWRASHGPVGTYRKVHTPQPVKFAAGTANAHESHWFSRGNAFPTFDLGRMRVGVHICYDRHIPESARSLALGGAEVVVLASNSQTYGASWRTEIWDMICRLRAYENTVFVVAANKTGREGEIEWHGRSCIVSPRGDVLAMAEQSDDDALVVVEVDLDDIAVERAKRRFLAERQPNAYQSDPVLLDRGHES